MDKSDIVCKFCDSYENGWCTNFGKDVHPDSSCKFFLRNIIELTCQNCGRKYSFAESDAIKRTDFCCKECESCRTKVL